MLNKNKVILSRLIYSFIVIAFLSGCSEDKIKGCTDPEAINYNPNATQNSNSCVYPRALTQEVLDNATIQFAKNRTGDFQDPLNNVYVPYGHYQSAKASLTFRDTYANIQLAGTPIISPGILIAHRVFGRTAFGDKDTLVAVALMYKQVRGYFSQGNDWEYIEIDASTRSTLHPNGLLPPPNSEKRGRLGACSGCHLQAKGDYLFTVTGS